MCRTARSRDVRTLLSNKIIFSCQPSAKRWWAVNKSLNNFLQVFRMRLCSRWEDSMGTLQLRLLLNRLMLQGWWEQAETFLSYFVSWMAARLCEFQTTTHVLSGLLCGMTVPWLIAPPNNSFPSHFFIWSHSFLWVLSFRIFLIRLSSSWNKK